MREELLPLFPLAVVLLPGNKLPLHIFEDRYREMIGEAISSGTEFGIVLAARGGIATEGCTATVEEVLKRHDDGRFDIMAVGRRRFLLKSIDQELPYLRGEVEYFGDDPGDAPEQLRERALEVCAAIESGEEVEAESTDPQLSFRLAQHFSDLTFRQQLLMTRTEKGRLESIVEYAPAYTARLREAAHMRELAGKNGHGHRPPGIED